MNKENMQIAINVMKRVRQKKYAFSLLRWQAAVNPERQEQELAECGTAACFGGWLAVSPEAQEKGMKSDLFDGAPVFEGTFGVVAIAEFLGITRSDARLLTGEHDSNTMLCPLYRCRGDEVTPSQVIEQLQSLLDTGSFKAKGATA